MAFRVPDALRAVAAASVLLLAPASAAADARDHDAARRAVESGEARPLTDILEAVRGKLPGEIVRVKIERKEGLWLYEFRIIDAKGRLFEAYVDALSGEIRRIKEK